MMRTDTLHMTLAFLGETDVARARELAQACTRWRLPTGTMVLREPGRFGHARVVWLGPSEEDRQELSWLYEANDRLWENLAAHGWKPRESVFRPHVSLLRNAGPASLSGMHGPAVHWMPDRCVLVASEPTPARSRYNVLADVPLVPVGA